MTKKPSQEEEEYFARQESARLKAAAIEKARQIQAEELEKRKQLHWMKCPKCGDELHTIVLHGVHADRCFHCNGTFLDAGELELLAGKEHGFLQKVLSVFKH